MLTEENKEILRRYISGDATREEVRMMESALASGELEPHSSLLLKENWNKLEVTDQVDLTHVLDRIHHRIHQQEEQKQAQPVRRFLKAYVRAAAILLIPLLMASIYTYLQVERESKGATEQLASSTITAPLGSRVSFDLPDGSKGFLNSGSSITFRLPFTVNRDVTLEGEAWFDVSRDPDHPFRVNAGPSEVKVLGTRFNVNAYPEENYLELVLESGRVEFKSHGESQAVIMEPDQMLIMTNNSLRIQKTDTEKYSGWTKGQLIFRGDNMLQVARRIGRWYNVTVEIAHEELESYTFVATFEDDSLEEVLRLLGMTSPIEYQIIPRHMLADATWVKKKVILTKRE